MRDAHTDLARIWDRDVSGLLLNAIVDSSFIVLVSTYKSGLYGYFLLKRLLCHA